MLTACHAPISLSFMEHLCYSLALAVMKDVTVNLLVQILISFPLDKFPEEGFGDHILVLVFTFQRGSILFSITICISTNAVQGSMFLHTLGNMYCYFFSFFFFITATLAGVRQSFLVFGLMFSEISDV